MLLSRAMLTNLVAGSVVQGGSTLTQQLAKNLFLQPNRTLERKLQEAVRGLKGEVAQSEGASNVTHVVHPFGEAGDPDKGGRYARTLEVRGWCTASREGQLSMDCKRGTTQHTLSSTTELDSRPTQRAYDARACTRSQPVGSASATALLLAHPISG